MFEAVSRVFSSLGGNAPLILSGTRSHGFNLSHPEFNLTKLAQIKTLQYILNIDAKLLLNSKNQHK